MTEKKATAARLLASHGTTFASELGVDLSRGTPAPLFQLLCFALLASARISADAAMQAARALAKAGWTSAEKMAGATWRERTDVLNQSGYARYDESTARMLEATSELLLETYDGDLRQLRAAADGNAADIRKRLKAFKGIGEVGADIFLREVQVTWQEVYPFADQLALKASRRIGLGDDSEALAKAVPKQEFARLVAALVRTELADDYDAIDRK